MLEAESLSPYHIDGWNKNNKCDKEPEVVFFPKIKFLGFQNHNEMMWRTTSDKDKENFVKWSQDLLNRFMSDKL